MPIHIRIYLDGENIDQHKRSFFRLCFDLDGENYISVLLYVFFIKFNWYPLRKVKGKPHKSKISKKKKKTRKMNWNWMKFLIQVAWQSIKKTRIKKVYLDMDTGNVIINANLHPVFELMNERPRINLNINYAGNFALNLDVQNNLWNVVQVFIWNLLKRSFIFTKYK